MKSLNQEKSEWIKLNSENLDAEKIPLILTVVEVAKILRVSRSLVYALVRSGELPSKRMGRRGIIRICRADLIRYIEGGWSAA